MLATQIIYAKDNDKIMNIDAEKYLCAFSDNFWNEENQKKLTDLVKDKEIKITGVIYKVHRDYIDGYWVTIRQQRNKKFSDRWAFISCYFKHLDNLGIKSGDKVTIQGYCKGWVSGALSLYRCELVKIY